MSPRRTWVGVGALAALGVLSVAVAASGPEIVPAAGRGSGEGWLEGLYGGGLGIDGDAVIWLERGMLLAWAVVLLCARALPARAVWGAIVGLVAVFAVAPPLLSLDVFSYVSYARLEAVHGLNPYENPPAAVPGDPAVPFVADFREQVSVYGPLFTLLTLPLGELGVGAAVWSLKALAAACVLATALLASRIAATRGADPSLAAALVALNPLVLVHVVGGAHNDALMALTMTTGVGLVLAGREAAGGVGLLAGAAVKASALVVAPFALIGAERRARLAAGFAIAAALVIGIGIAVFGTAIDEALRVVGDNQDRPSYASLPATLSRELGLDLDLARGLCLAAFALALAALLRWCLRGGDWVRGAGWATLGLLLASSYLTPWYVIWALPLAAIGRDRALQAGAVALTAFLLIHQVPGLGG
jgi:hypothetical protein